MKKASTFIVIVATLSLCISCSKNKSYSNYFGFRGTSYPVSISSRDSVHTAITFVDPTTVPTATITITFPDSFPNTIGNSFQTNVAAGNPSISNYPKLLLTIGTRSYYPTGNGPTSIFFSLSPAGKLSLYTQSQYPIWMSGGLPGGSIDSAQLSINVSE